MVEKLEVHHEDWGVCSPKDGTQSSWFRSNSRPAVIKKERREKEEKREKKTGRLAAARGDRKKQVSTSFESI